MVQEFIAKKSIQLIDHPLYSLDPVPSDFTLFPKIKKVLAGTLNTQDSLKKTWDGVLRTKSKTTSPAFPELGRALLKVHRHSG